MGRFIVIEGLDGAGTTTQAALLNDWLDHAGEVVLTREPTAGVVGRLIRSTLRGDADAPLESSLPWLFAADRAEHLARTVEPALARGAWVVSDRYYHSSLAYQSLVQPLERVAALNPFRAPDLTVFVEVPVEVALARVHKRGGQLEIFEERGRLEAIAAAYDRVIELVLARGERVVRVDGTGSVEAVFAEVKALVAAMETR